VILPLLTWLTAGEQTYDLLVVPLFSVQRKRPGDIKVAIPSAVGGLFEYERLGATGC